MRGGSARNRRNSSDRGGAGSSYAFSNEQTEIGADSAEEGACELCWGVFRRWSERSFPEDTAKYDNQLELFPPRPFTASITRIHGEEYLRASSSGNTASD